MEKKSTILAAAITLALTGQQAASAAAISVTSLSDSAFVVGCTLRQAINAANTNTAQAGCPAGDLVPSDVIEFDTALGSGTITLSQGQIAIDSSLTIDGSGSLRRGITVSGNNASRIFDVGNVGSGASVILRGLVLRDGQVVDANGGAVRSFADELLIDNCTLTGNSARLDVPYFSASGGALFIASGQTTVMASSVSQNSTNSRGGGLSIASGGTLTVVDSTISDNSAQFGGGLVAFGQTTMDEVIFSGNMASASGGAIFAGSAFLTASNTSFDGNVSSGDGGGLFQSNSAETLISESTMINNQATNSGGGLATDGITTLVDVNILDNTATNTGGGIRTLDDGDLSMTRGSLVNNSADRGGGMMHYGSANLSQVTVSGNTGSVRGGGVYSVGNLRLIGSTLVNNAAGVNGAAIFTASNRTATLENVTVSNNTSVFTGVPSFPAAVYGVSAFTITNSTLLNNAPNGITKANGAEMWNITNTVIAGSAEADCVAPVTAIDENLNNLIGDGSCADGAMDLVVGPPLLGPLADNGGATQTHQPLSGSSVVDAGNNAGCPDPDQTGMPRPIDGNADGNSDCDIGSVEFVDLFGPLRTLTSAPDVTIPGDSSYPLTVTYTDVDGEVDVFTPGLSDITVLPGPLTVLSTSLSGNAAQLSVTYNVLPPGGLWDFGDGGTYTVSVNPDEIRDIAVTGANSAAAGDIGQFQVLIGEIQISGNSLPVSDGDTSPAETDGTDLGQVRVGNTRMQTFVISNLGSGTVNLTAPVEVLGANFSVSQPMDSELSANESTEFQLSFSPQVLGTATAVVTLLNTDSDENPYTFAVQAEGIAATESIFADGFEQ